MAESTFGALCRYRDVRGSMFRVLRRGGVEIERGLDGLRSYWLADGNFMRDHFLFSRNSRWVVKLDQDVTLFAGDVTFLADVVARLGGVEHVEKMMRRDLIGTVEDVVGLGGYVKGLLAPLNASTP
ncbi:MULTISPECIES: hypothetical protein [unclassified Stenotrophomonas]|uniref:hypothetical protein n=1 Tax=unclassified Stenotrophomonas TaxID=196198 RepID=UPI0024498F8C|nr:MULTISPECIES: hypothetical protein [unclassified Stenotrophomonas]MDG9845009.1 hypothetical protein [Stenotrophomonas sp. GD04054]MDH0017205.1 hypothetical protein [Stenotrophomonas sp. GD04028]MDH0577519.1 hypothetical protein [Stenotrophomonas sp. GD03997]MDH0861284.1 hypothetical protein [Stenotrophomonas sp. GD03882]